MNMNITVIFLVAFAAIGLFCYALFPRKTNNLLMKLIPAWEKRYVVCHIRYVSGKTEPWKVIPSKDGLTLVGKYHFDLAERYILMKYEGRPHYILDERDSIPISLIERTKEEIIFQSAEIQTALTNTVMEYLFSRKKDILIIGLFVVAILSVLGIMYAAYEISSMKEAIAQTNSIVQVIK